MEDETTESRDYFRIQDEVHLSYDRLTENQYRQRHSQSTLLEGPFLQGAKLRALTSEMGRLLTGIRKSHPDLAHYLSLLDRKVEILTHMVEVEQLGKEMEPNARVNLSAGGIEFGAPEAIPPQTRLDLKLVLFPSYTCLRTLGTVLHCRQEPEADLQQPYRIGVEFTDIPETEREALVRHVLERQSVLLRKERERG